MARIFMSGAEAGSMGVVAPYEGATVSTVQKAHGDYSFLTDAGYESFYASWDSAVSEVYMQANCYVWGLDGLFGSVGGGIGFVDSTGIMNRWVGFVNNNRYNLSLYSGLSTLVASVGAVFPTNEWFLMEIWFKPLNSGGRVVVKINGTIQMDYTGDTVAGQEDVQKLHFGNKDSTRYTKVYYDDIIVNDASGAVNNSWPGGAAIYALTPDGAGTTTELDPSAGANYECVDDIPPDDDTSYVESDVQDEIDTYAMSASVGEGTIGAVQWLCRAKANSAGITEVARVLRVNGTDYVGSDIRVSETYGYAQEILESNPDDSAAWEYTDLDALEAGLKVR